MFRMWPDCHINRGVKNTTEVEAMAVLLGPMVQEEVRYQESNASINMKLIIALIWIWSAIYVAGLSGAIIQCLIKIL